jgi:hypothetical protein
MNVVESFGELEEPQQTGIHHLTILNGVTVNLMAKTPTITLEVYPALDPPHANNNQCTKKYFFCAGPNPKILSYRTVSGTGKTSSKVVRCKML